MPSQQEKKIEDAVGTHTFKVRHRRHVSHALVLEARDLQTLWTLMERYPDRRVKAECSDDSTIEAANIEAVLRWDNPNYRRIEGLSFVGSGQTPSGQPDPHEQFALSVQNQFEESASLVVDSLNDQEAEGLATQVAKVLGEAKPDYDMLSRQPVDKWLPLATFLLAMGAYWPVFLAGNLAQAIVLIVLIFALGILVNRPLSRMQSRLYPRLFVRLGRQDQEWHKREHSRKTFSFNAFVVAVVSSIVASVIYAVAGR